ncbi:MAG: polyhydroxyalkanoate synthesis repressor PhaR, partial [Pseudoxanthomonas sp.]
GQTPWAMMNQLTERNLELWQEFQRGLGSGSMGRPVAPRPGTEPPPRDPNPNKRR